MSQKSLLIEGLSDAAGFLGGALLGMGAGRLLGLDLSAEGYGAGVMGAILLVGIGGGLGLQLARRWRNRKAATTEPKED